MSQNLDLETATARARNLIDTRIESVRALVTARQSLHERRAEVAVAEAEDLKAYRAALSDGWTPDELRKVGLEQPAKTARARGPRPRAKAVDTTQESADAQ